MIDRTTGPTRRSGRTRRPWPVLLGGLVVAGGVFVTAASSAASRDSHERGRETVELADARLKFEINATDGDGGVQLFVDGDQWRWLSVRDPNGRRIFSTRTSGSMALQGGTELFLESAEPTFDELPLEQLLERFPEGDYQVEGRTIDDQRLTGIAPLTHRLPDGPVLVDPVEGAGPQDPSATTLHWKTVAPPGGGDIIAYQVIVVRPDTGIAALPNVTLDVMMPPEATSLTIPDGFLQPDTEYEWEVLAIDESGNQTLSSSLFVTAS